MHDVIDLCEKQPHIRMTVCNGDQHVIPVSALRGIVNGLYPASHLGEDVLRAIIADFIFQLPPSK